MMITVLNMLLTLFTRLKYSVLLVAARTANYYPM